MRIKYLLISTIVLTALFLSLNLAVAQSVENAAKGETDELNKWCFNMGSSMDRELSIRSGDIFPVMDTGISHRGRTPIYNYDNPEACSWNETATRFSIRVPLDFSTNADPELHENDVLKPITYALSYGRFRQMSSEDLYPSFGQSVEVSYSHAPVKTDFNGAMFAVQTKIFLPGLFKHHSLNMEGGYERQRSGTYVLKSQLRPRGYSYEYHRNIYSASINYTMPLLRPNLSSGRTLNLRQIKANLFYDHAIGRGGGNDATYNSVGAELSFDIDSSRLPVVIDLGMRFSYRLSDNEYEIEPVVFGVRF